jgi:hypothetical protein
MEALLQGHAHDDYVTAFRWTVILLAVVTAAGSQIFARLKKDRGRAANVTR